MNDRRDITRVLVEWSQGSKDAYNQLFPMVYDELRSLANRQINRERGIPTINRTALVHELYIKMIDQSISNWNNRKHFFFIATRCMRQILIDHARKKMALKRGSAPNRITLQEQKLANDDYAEVLIAIDDLTYRLSEFNERLGRVFELRFFAGLTIRETADMLSISESTVDRDWLKARGWIYRELISDHKVSPE